MMRSSFCFRCIQAMSHHELFVDDDNPWRENRLRTESRSLHLDPLEGIWAVPLDRLRYHWQACIEGPAGSPYEGGKFYLYMQVPYTYPMTPPVVRFITKIFHPNVSRHGDIGIDSIQHNWSLALTVGKVLISIQSLLTDPYCEVSALLPQVSCDVDKVFYCRSAWNRKLVICICIIVPSSKSRLLFGRGNMQ